MFTRSLLNVQKLLHSVPHQARGFAQKVVPNQVFQYFCRAKLIDSLRLSLRSGSPDSLLRILDNPHLDSFVVTNALRSAPSPDSALSLVDALSRIPNFSHTQHSLHAIAKILAKSGRTAQLKKLVEAINAGKFTKVPPVSLLDHMRWYAACGDLDSVLCVWDKLRAQGKRPCIESYNLVMGLYVQMGKDLEAVQTFQSIMQGGAIPNSRTFTIVIEHLVNAGRADMAKEIFDAMPLMRFRNTLKQYSILVRAFSNLERLDDVKSLLRQMRLEGLLLPRSMLPLLQHMQDAGFLEETNEFLREMAPDDRIKKIKLCADRSDGEDEGEEEEDPDDDSSNADGGARQLMPWLDPGALASALRHWRPDDVSALEAAKLVWTSRLVCKMIRHFKLPQTAWQFFCWVAHQPGFTHDIHTYSKLITKLVSRGKVDLADDILSKVRSEGIKLGFSTVRQIIDFYGVFKEGDAALRVFRDVEVLCGRLSESDMLLLYSSLLQTLVKCGRGFDAMHVVERMLSLGIHPKVPAFSGLMHHFAIKSDFNTVHKLFGMVRQSGLEPDAYMYRTLIHAYCSHGKATLALRLFENMRSSHLTLDGASKSLLARSLWKEGRLREASVVEEACKEIDNNLPRPSTGHLFNINSSDLKRVYNIYCDSFQAFNG